MSTWAITLCTLAGDQWIASSTGALQSLLGLFRKTPWSKPYSKQKRASSKVTSLGVMQYFNWTARISCCGCFPHLVNCWPSFSCLHSSRHRAFGCLSVLFLPTPGASKSVHSFILVTQMGPLLAQAPFRVFTLLIPFACHHPSISPELATIKITS